MTKRIYSQPEVSEARIASMNMICTSSLGIGGAGDLNGARAPRRAKPF